MILLLYCLLLLYLSYSCRDMTDAARILKTTTKCHLKQNKHSFYHHIPCIHIIVITTISVMVKCKPKCFLHFLEVLHYSQFTHLPPSQYIIDSFTYVSTRSHPPEVHANMTLRWQHHSSWSSYGQITKHALHVLSLFNDI